MVRYRSRNAGAARKAVVFHTRLNSIFSACARLGRPTRSRDRPYATKETSPVPKMNFLDFFNAGHTRPTSEHQRLTRLLTLIIPINFPVVVIITLLLVKRHRLVLVLVVLVLLNGSLVVLRRCQRGHPPRIHQTLLAVHA